MRANLKAKFKQLKTDHSTKATLPLVMASLVVYACQCFVFWSRTEDKFCRRLYFITNVFSFQAALEGMAHVPKLRCQEMAESILRHWQICTGFSELGLACSRAPLHCGGHDHCVVAKHQVCPPLWYIFNAVVSKSSSALM